MPRFRTDVGLSRALSPSDSPCIRLGETEKVSSLLAPSVRGPGPVRIRDPSDSQNSRSDVGPRVQSVENPVGRKLQFRSDLFTVHSAGHSLDDSLPQPSASVQNWTASDSDGQAPCTSAPTQSVQKLHSNCSLILKLLLLCFFNQLRPYETILHIA